jgi:hypothetical protein
MLIGFVGDPPPDRASGLAPEEPSDSGSKQNPLKDRRRPGLFARRANSTAWIISLSIHGGLVAALFIVARFYLTGASAPHDPSGALAVRPGGAAGPRGIGGSGFLLQQLPVDAIVSVPGQAGFQCLAFAEDREVPAGWWIRARPPAQFELLDPSLNLGPIGFARNGLSEPPPLRSGADIGRARNPSAGPQTKATGGAD